MSIEARVLQLAEQQGARWRSKGFDYSEILSVCYEAGLNPGEIDQITASKKMLLMAYQGYIEQGLSQDAALAEAFKTFFKTAGRKVGQITRRIISASYNHWLKEIRDPKLALTRTYQEFLWPNEVSTEPNEILRAMQRGLKKNYEEEKLRKRKEVSWEDLKKEPIDGLIWQELDRIEALDLLRSLLAILKTYPYGDKFMTALSMYVLYGEPWEVVVSSIPRKELMFLKKAARDLLLTIYNGEQPEKFTGKPTVNKQGR